jgi:hypothetical protein
LRNALGVHIRADNIVARRGMTRTRYDTHVAATNHREIQGVSPKMLKGVHFD